jgi:hypothetical protein
MQLRQPLLRPDMDCGHSRSTEATSNTMNSRLRDRIALGSALAMGLGVSTGHPLGIIAAAVMPLACLAPGTRKAAAKSRQIGYSPPPIREEARASISVNWYLDDTPLVGVDDPEAMVTVCRTICAESRNGL